MDLRTTGMEFASEMIIKATLERMKIAEVPTTLSPDGRSRPPHLRPYRDGWRHLRFMLLYSPTWLFLFPGLALMLVGLAGTALLEQDSIQLSHAHLGLDTLIYLAFMSVCGYQSVLFAVLSRIFAIEQHLYPASPGYRHIFRFINLERGLIVGALITMSGIASAVHALLMWRNAGFGNLNIEHIARIVIPSGMAITLGFETVLFSFFLSTLGINIRRNSADVPESYGPAEVSGSAGPEQL
jgi:hypothetical protein